MDCDRKIYVDSDIKPEIQLVKHLRENHHVSLLGILSFTYSL